MFVVQFGFILNDWRMELRDEQRMTVKPLGHWLITRQSQRANGDTMYNPNLLEY